MSGVQANLTLTATRNSFRDEVRTGSDSDRVDLKRSSSLTRSINPVATAPGSDFTALTRIDHR